MSLHIFPSIPDDPPGASRLLVLSCSATKSPAPGTTPALYRYDGPLWQTLRAADPQRQKTKVAFLSARHGFQEATARLENYDTRLTADLAQRMIAGGMTTRWPRPSSQRKPDNAGMHPGAEIASMSRYGRKPFRDVALVGGHLYPDAMGAFLKEFVRMKCVVDDAHVTEINGPIGLMRRELRLWINRHPEGYAP